MELIVSIDDTDNIESSGTGVLAQGIARIIIENSWGICERVSRHQLLLDDGIPYTSHNSAMVFRCTIEDEYFQELVKAAQDYLINNSAIGSDPGLCIVNVDMLTNQEELLRFSQSAQQKVLNKKQAYTLAKRLNIHLSEHGGTGQGVIGALAGAGLRMSGDDGEMRGTLQGLEEGRVYSAKQLIVQQGIDQIKDLADYRLQEGDKITIGNKAKTILQDGKWTLLVYRKKDKKGWKSCSKQQRRMFGAGRNV